MRIDPKSQIAGVPAVKVRDFLKRNPNGWHVDRLAYLLKLSASQGQALVAELLARSYIEASRSPDVYDITLNGSSFTSATAAAPLTRRAAERALTKFFDRIRAVNANTDYLVWVSRAIVFGSYLSDKERISDVDVAVELVRKARSGERFVDAALARAAEAEVDGRRFRTYVDRLRWAEDEVLMYLQNRSRAIALITADNPILGHVTGKRVYEFPLADQL